jgi:hypothetical protein
LCNYDGPDGAATGSQAQTTGAYSSRENLGKMSNRCSRGSTVVGFHTSEPYTQAAGPNPILKPRA